MKMINILFSRLCILMCGILYPGYMSFKTVRAKNDDDYVKWMMYWIVFAVFTSIEAFADIFLTWFLFYYELKVVLIVWILPTTGNGSSFVYKQLIEPLLKKHEKLIDFYLSQIREKGQELVLQYAKKAMVCFSRSLIDVLNKSFPNGVLGLFPKYHLADRPVVPISQNSMDEMGVEVVSEKMQNRQKGSTKARRNKECKAVENVQVCKRRTRQNKEVIDYNLK